jgi:protein disulfide-isomerase A1
MKVNCQNKNICNQFEVKHYPTIKIFIDGHKSSEEPGRDAASILQFIHKQTSPAIVELQSDEELKNFRNNYGEDTFVVYYDGDKNSELYKCIEQLAEKKFKPYFYFGIYHDEANKTATIVVK